MTDDLAADLLWLVQRASCLRKVANWSRAEKDRSWLDWQTHADAALARAATQQGTHK